MNKKDLYLTALENGGIELYDLEGYLWIYSPKEHRVYLLDAELEFIRDGVDVMENGYPASTLKKAVKIVSE